jgi:hypothetical protein
MYMYNIYTYIHIYMYIYINCTHVSYLVQENSTHVTQCLRISESRTRTVHLGPRITNLRECCFSGRRLWPNSHMHIFFICMTAKLHMCVHTYVLACLMCILIHTYIHIFIYTYIHTYIHTSVRIHDYSLEHERQETHRLQQELTDVSQRCDAGLKALSQRIDMLEGA